MNLNSASLHFKTKSLHINHVSSLHITTMLSMFEVSGSVQQIVTVVIVLITVMKRRVQTAE